jgi:hypothetical protein
MFFKRIISAIFLLIFICQTFDKNFISLNFYANQTYIAHNLCENRNKPEVHCNGKCQLQKKLNQEASKDKQNPERRNDNSSEVISSKTFFATLDVPFTIIIKKQFSFVLTATPVDQSLSFFHPPQSFFI